MKDRYINPFTDFGFKRIFEPEEVEEYEESLKVYRDLKNSLDTAREEGKIEGSYEIAESMLKNGEDDQKVTLYTGLTLEDIQELKKKLNLCVLREDVPY